MAKLFDTPKKASFKTTAFRRIMNIFPSYWGSGGKVKFVSDDWREAHILLRLNWRTRNYVGSIFGGSLYAAADPMLMIQLMQVLGKDYVVWDKSAAIKFIRPGKGRLRMRFLVNDQMIEDIKEAVQENGEYSFTEELTWLGKEDQVFALVEKEIYVATKSFYKEKQAKKRAEHGAKP
jgi:acyl-coenzyme A thioesterase PaaI-like protein